MSTHNETYNWLSNRYDKEELDNIIDTYSTNSTSLNYTSHTNNYINYPEYLSSTGNCSNIAYVSAPTLTLELTKEMITTMNANMKIKDVEIIVPNKVVKVTFDDDTFEKAVCHEDDNFSLDTAITICIAKHLLGGSGKFNNILTKAVKIVNDKVKAEKEAEKEKARIEAKRLKNHLKRLAKKEKRLIDEKNMRIKEKAEAIVLAYEMMNTKSEQSNEE